LRIFAEVTASAAIVVATAPVPEPVTSPVREVIPDKSPNTAELLPLIIALVQYHLSTTKKGLVIKVRLSFKYTPAFAL